MNYVIRKIKKDDCKQIAHVVTIAWNESYKGLVPDSFLNGLYENEEQRATNIYNDFNENNNHQFVLEIDNKVVGFVSVGETDEKEYKNCGELYAIYIIKDYKGKGFGKQLFEAGKNELKNMGFNKMIIGCLEGNLANGFYKHQGRILSETRIFEKPIIRKCLLF